MVDQSFKIPLMDFCDSGSYQEQLRSELKGGWSELESGVQKMHIGIVNYR